MEKLPKAKFLLGTHFYFQISAVLEYEKNAVMYFFKTDHSAVFFPIK